MRLLMEKNSTTASYIASGATVVFGLSATEFAAIVGALVAIATFAVNWYYKHQAFELMRKKRQSDQCLPETGNAGD